MNTITVLTLAIGLGELLLALLVFLGWDRKYMASKVSWLVQLAQRVKLAPILLIGGFLFSGIGLYRTFSITCEEPKSFKSENLEEIRDRNFANEKVEIDGRLFKHCTFTSVTFVYNGKAAFGFSDVEIKGGFMMSTDNLGIEYTIALLRAFDLLKSDVPLIDENLRPIDIPLPKVDTPGPNLK